MKFGSKLAEQFQFLGSQKSQYSTFEVSYMNPLPIEALRYWNQSRYIWASQAARKDTHAHDVVFQKIVYLLVGCDRKYFLGEVGYLRTSAVIGGTSQDGQAGRQAGRHPYEEGKGDFAARNTVGKRDGTSLQFENIWNPSCYCFIFSRAQRVCGVMLYDISGEGKPRPNSRQNRLLPLPWPCRRPTVFCRTCNRLLWTAYLHRIKRK